MATKSIKQKKCWCIITLLAQISAAFSDSQTELHEPSYNDSLNSEREQKSFCHPDGVSRMTHTIEDQISTLNVDLEKIGWNLGHTILEVQNHALKYHVKKNMVAFDCKLVDICINPFSLRTLMKSNVEPNANYVVDFYAVSDSEIMYLEDGVPNYIYKQDFEQFALSNVFINLDNVTSHLLYSRNEVNSRLGNSANGTCFCKESVSLSNIKRKQSLVIKQLKKLVSIFLESFSSLNMKLTEPLYVCLETFIKGDICELSDHREKRSLFGSSSSHDEIRRVTNVFQSNFKRILTHDRKKAKDLQHLKQNLINDENDISELKSYLRGYKIIQELQSKQMEIHQYLLQTLQILFEDLTHSDVALILKLLGGHKTCEYLTQLNKCVSLAGFTVERNTLRAKFVHKKLTVANFILFSCSVFLDHGNYYINNLHNRLTASHEVGKFNYTRLVSQKDYILQGLEIVARKVLVNNSNLCYDMICLNNVTYYVNGSVKMCKKDDSLLLCDTFVLKFKQGVISSDYLADSKIEHLGWGSPLMEHVNGIMKKTNHETEVIENNSVEDEMIFEEPDGWLLKQDIIETLGYSVGFLIFLGIVAIILYLKCKNKNSSTAVIPWFGGVQRGVQMVGLEQSFEPLHQPASQPIGYVPAPQPDPDNIWDNSCQERTFTDSAAGKQPPPSASEHSPSHNGDKKGRLRNKQQSDRDHSLISSIIRTA